MPTSPDTSSLLSGVRSGNGHETNSPHTHHHTCSRAPTTRESPAPPTFATWLTRLPSHSTQYLYHTHAFPTHTPSPPTSFITATHTHTHTLAADTGHDTHTTTRHTHHTCAAAVAPQHRFYVYCKKPCGQMAPGKLRVRVCHLLCPFWAGCCKDTSFVLSGVRRVMERNQQLIILLSRAQTTREVCSRPIC